MMMFCNFHDGKSKVVLCLFLLLIYYSRAFEEKREYCDCLVRPSVRLSYPVTPPTPFEIGT